MRTFAGITPRACDSTHPRALARVMAVSVWALPAQVRILPFAFFGTRVTRPRPSADASRARRRRAPGALTSHDVMTLDSIEYR